MSVVIEIEDERWKNLRGLKKLCETAVLAALPARLHSKTVTLLLADDATLKSLNHDWRGKNKPTNVLSFPTSPEVKIPRGEAKPLGDIALSYETVTKEAEQSGISLKHHTTHLVVHGVLHLLGYDHMDEAEATAMEAKEVRILKKLGLPDPYQN